MTTPIKVEQVSVTQADRDLRDALERHAYENESGEGFLTDDALPLIAAFRLAAEAKTREEDARIVKDPMRVIRRDPRHEREDQAWNRACLNNWADILSRMETDNAK